MLAASRRSIPTSYFDLVRRFPLIRIANDEDLADALTTVDELLTQELDAGGEAYLGALTSLIHDFESQHYPVPDATPAEVLRELASANELTEAAIAQRTGIVPSTVSALMSGKRRPTPEQMTSLAAIFGVSPVVFIQVPETVQRGKRRQA